MSRPQSLRHVYVFVRSDISKPQQVVQSTHAGIAVARSGLIDPTEPSPLLVILRVESQADLFAVADLLSQHGISYRGFVEEDLDDQLTAIATRPVEAGERKLFRDFKLVA